LITNGRQKFTELHGCQRAGKFIGIYGNGTQGVDDSGSARLNNYLQRHNRSSQYGVNLNLSGPFEFLNRDHQLVFGGDYQKENFNNLFGSLSNTREVNIYSWDPEASPNPIGITLAVISTMSISVAYTPQHG
jgi:outer membrane receptor for ferric coprogen and ferric-rhodotorulic acid